MDLKGSLVVGTEEVEKIRIFFERDIRKREVFVFPEIQVKGIGERYRITAMALEVDIPTVMSVRGASGWFAMDNSFAFQMVQDLGNQGYHAESNTEKDRRIKDLQDHIHFLEQVVLNRLGVKEEEVELLRKIRS